MEWNSPSQADQVHFDPADVFEAGLCMHHIANTAYPIGHVVTMKPYRIPGSAAQDTATSGWEGIERLGLYVHVPFCETRCSYCEYVVVNPDENAGAESLYFVLLLQEFELYRQALETEAKQLIGFDIGGGTPALVRPQAIEKVIEAARQSFSFFENAVISIETTPKIAALQPEKMRALFQMGIGRISMGVQTINPKLLERVGRDSTRVAWNQTAVSHIRAAGFRRFNIDVMYGFAGQSLASWEATLRHVIDLDPEYVTLYRMRYKGTRLAPQARQVSRDQVYNLYRMAFGMLAGAGYEPSPGKNTFSRLEGDVGTSDYLTERVINGTPYLGLGLGAQSLTHKTLSYNAGAAGKNLRPYQRQIESSRLPLQDVYHLSLPVAMAKMIAVSFYFGEINRSRVEEKFGMMLQDAFAVEISFLMERGLMEWTPESLRLTLDGVRQVNGVIALFFSGAVKAHLIKLSKTGSR